MLCILASALAFGASGAASADKDATGESPAESSPRIRPGDD
jgi:hypothetical protein